MKESSMTATGKEKSEWPQRLWENGRILHWLKNAVIS